MSQELPEEVLEAIEDVSGYRSEYPSGSVLVRKTEAKRIARLAYAAGRASMKEEAAKVCEETVMRWIMDEPPTDTEAADMRGQFAAAIRALP